MADIYRVKKILVKLEENTGKSSQWIYLLAGDAYTMSGGGGTSVALTEEGDVLMELGRHADAAECWQSVPPMQSGPSRSLRSGQMERSLLQEGQKGSVLQGQMGSSLQRQAAGERLSWRTLKDSADGEQCAVSSE